MTALSPVPATGRSAATRWVVRGVVAVALVAFAIWAKSRIDGLDTSTQATNPIIRWEWLFLRERTPDELREMTIQHLQLTVIPMAIGITIATGLTLVARKLRWSLTPITVVTSFLYTIPSFALFGILRTLTTNFQAAVIALTSYSLLVLVRNFVAGLDGVPGHVLDAADGLGMGPLRRLITVEIPLALPVIFTGIRVATVTIVGLVAVSSIIQLGGLGSLIFEGYKVLFSTKIVVGTVLSILLATLLDLLLDWVGRLLTPWARRKAEP
ncbi:MAG: ABC transporter permease [Aquihabitans sp.]